MKVAYWYFTPENTKDFIQSIDWITLENVFSEYEKWLWVTSNAHPEKMKVGWIGNILGNAIGMIRGEIVWWYYHQRGGKIQINTTPTIKEYLLLQSIIHELTHARWFNAPGNKSGYSIGKKHNAFNEWVTQKMTEELTREYVHAIGSSEEMIYLIQVTKAYVAQILRSDEQREILWSKIPSIQNILAQERDKKEVISRISKEIMEHPRTREVLDENVQRNMESTSPTYVQEVQIVDKLIAELSAHSEKSEETIWKIIKKWYFEWINIMELCNNPLYWIGFSKERTIELLK